MRGLMSSIGSMPSYPSINRLFFLTFLAFVMYRYVDGGHRLDILATIRFEFLLGGLAIIMAMVKISGVPAQVGPSKGVIVFIVLLFVAMILQIPMAADPVVARRVFNDRVFKFAMLTFLIAAMVESPVTLKAFIGAFLFATFYITLEATRGLISGSLVWMNQGVMRLHGSVPMYGHPNSLAGLAMGALPFVVFLFIPFRKKIYRICLLAAASTSLACVLFSGSRTSYVGLISLAMWWFFQSPRKIRFLTYLAVVIAVALPNIPEQYTERFKSIGGQEAEGHSRETRKTILRDAMIIFQENPLGVGIGSFPAVRMVRFGRKQDTHNLYLEVATNLGIQGLLIFLGLIGAMMASLRNSAMAFRNQRLRIGRLLRRKDLPSGFIRTVYRHEQDLSFCLSTAQATAGFLVVRLVLGLFGMDLYEIYWWFAAGLVLTLAGLVVRTNRKTFYYMKLTDGIDKDDL